MYLAHARPSQLDLLHPPRQESSWQTLPTALRDQTVKLLVQPLQAHQRRCLRAENHEEAGDEWQDQIAAFTAQGDSLCSPVLSVPGRP